MPLISRSKMPPGGWQYFSPQTGWRNPNPTQCTFRDTVSKIIQHNRNNPRFNLPTEPDDVSNELDRYTCARLNYDPGWCYGHLTPQTEELKKKPQPKGVLAQLADAANTVINGAKTITDWLSGGGKPVCADLAQQRADICKACSKNGTPSFHLEAAAWTVMKAANIQKIDDLGECKVCNCQLPLKVWLPFFDIDANTNPNLYPSFPSQCWVKGEHKRITVVIPYYSGDYQLLIKLFDWMKTLGGTENNRCLLVKDNDILPGQSRTAESSAKSLFSEVEHIEAEKGVNGWPGGPNRMFKSAIAWIEQNSSSPFLWLEPDAIPLTRDWITKLEDEYWKAGKPFMGHVVQSDNKKDAWLTGVAVYPCDTYTRMAKFCDKKGADGKHIAFDFVAGKEVATKAHITPIIQQNYAGKRKTPTFSEMKAAPNVLDLTDISPYAVLYHQCKDGSLTELLRRNMAQL